jgi:hypothetical protein
MVIATYLSASRVHACTLRIYTYPPIAYFSFSSLSALAFNLPSTTHISRELYSSDHGSISISDAHISYNTAPLGDMSPSSVHRACSAYDGSKDPPNKQPQHCQRGDLGGTRNSSW